MQRIMFGSRLLHPLIFTTAHGRRSRPFFTKSYYLSPKSKAPVQIEPAASPKMKIAVLGASGGIGQPLSLLLKHSTMCTDLNLYDLNGSVGVATDLSHIETRCRVEGFMGNHQLHSALEGADIVVIPAGLPRRPGMERDDLFKTNASIVFELVHACSEVCPKAMIAIISNPINSMVPLAAEVLKKAKVFDKKRLFGVTTLDVVRANTFIAEKKGLDPENVYCPVICGHSGRTIVPLITHCTPSCSFEPDELRELTEKIQEAGTFVVKAKGGAGSATLSMAYAGARFVYSLMRAIRGEESVIECAYVKTDKAELPYFASQCLLGKDGIHKYISNGKLSTYEKELLLKALPELMANVEKGEKFAKEKLSDVK